MSSSSGEEAQDVGFHLLPLTSPTSRTSATINTRNTAQFIAVEGVVSVIHHGFCLHMPSMQLLSTRFTRLFEHSYRMMAVCFVADQLEGDTVLPCQSRLTAKRPLLLFAHVSQEAMDINTGRPRGLIPSCWVLSQCGSHHYQRPLLFSKRVT